MLLHVSSQSPPHYLKGDEAIRDAQFLCNWTDPPSEEVLGPTRNCLTLPFPPSERGEHKGIWRDIVTDRTPGFDDWPYLIGHWNRRLALPGLHPALKELPVISRAMWDERFSCPGLPLEPHDLACAEPAEDAHVNEAKIVHIFAVNLVMMSFNQEYEQF